jgi:hypothetical protein
VAGEAEETQVSWEAVAAHLPVETADGKEIGKVVEVACLAKEDIFHGIVFSHHALGQHLLAPADNVARITDRAVYLNCDETAAEAFEQFTPMHIETLGVRGIFKWKHLGWTKSDN